MRRLFLLAGFSSSTLYRLRHAKDIKFTTMLRLCSAIKVPIQDFAFELSREYLVSLEHATNGVPTRSRVNTIEMSHLKAFAAIPMSPPAKRESLMSKLRRRRKEA